MSAPDGLAARLAAEMERWSAAGLRRELSPADFDLASGGADFTSNDYLGLARHPALIAAAHQALERFGAGGRASRLLGGGSPLDREAERAAAGWLGAEEALLFPSGYHANLGLIGALAGPGDVVLSDESNHASLIDAIRLSRARAMVYRHADPLDLECRLAALRGAPRVLVATESVFSMDGDMAPLGSIADACARHRAALVVDEAHACGLIGPAGAGGWAALGPARAADPVLAGRVVTGGKALGSAGALVVGSAAVREHLINHARTFAFTTAAPPAAIGALRAALELAPRMQAERERVLLLARRLAQALDLPAPSSAIVPFVVGDAAEAVRAAEGLQRAGLLVRAVRPPTVPAGSSRLRIACHAFNTDREVDRLIEALGPIRRSSEAASVVPARARAAALVVCGTDTGVGKTVVSALLQRAAARGGSAAYWKPVQTGPDSDTDAVEVLALVAGARRFEPACRFELAASPHQAAASEGKSLDIERIDALLDGHLRVLGSGVLLIELAGGLLVPWTLELTQLDWLARRRLPLILVSRSGLGTLNHTLLSLEALRARQLEPRALFLVGPAHESNRETLRRLASVTALYELPPLDPLDAPSLDAWIDAHDLAPVWPEPRP